MKNPIKISGVIITFNEERNISRCIASMKDIVDEIIVVDSFSSDRTPEISQQLGATVYSQSFLGHVEQKNYAMDKANHRYILSLDADEMLSEAMKEEIKRVKENCEFDGYVFNRFNNYCGKWLRYSWYPDRKLRLWDKSKGKWGGTNPHDKVIMQQDAKIRKVKADILHYAYMRIDEHMEQIKKFAIIAAEAKYNKGVKSNFLLDIILSPIYKFIKKYIFKLGFLDGYYGFLFCVLSAYLNFMKYTKLWELNNQKQR